MREFATFTDRILGHRLGLSFPLRCRVRTERQRSFVDWRGVKSGQVQDVVKVGFCNDGIDLRVIVVRRGRRLLGSRGLFRLMST